MGPPPPIDTKQPINFALPPPDFSVPPPDFDFSVPPPPLDFIKPPPLESIIEPKKTKSEIKVIPDNNHSNPVLKSTTASKKNSHKSSKGWFKSLNLKATIRVATIRVVKLKLS